MKSKNKINSAINSASNAAEINTRRHELGGGVYDFHIVISLKFKRRHRCQ